ncbi:unnamed protein product [Phaeothamnion confervicola]
MIQRQYFAWKSPLLKKKMEMLVFGHSGQNWLVFPTAKGRFFDWEGFGMIDALREPLERGWLQLTCLDSFDTRALYSRRLKPWFKIWKHDLYDQYVRNEVVPFVHNYLGSPYLGTAGASFGGYHAMNFGLRHPDVISKVVAMSGVFDLSFRLGRFSNSTSYFHNPMAYVPGLWDERISRMGFHLGVAAHEKFASQHVTMAQMLDRRGARVSLEVDPRGDHSWGYWSYLARKAV